VNQSSIATFNIGLYALSLSIKLKTIYSQTKKRAGIPARLINIGLTNDKNSAKTKFFLFAIVLPRNYSAASSAAGAASSATGAASSATGAAASATAAAAACVSGQFPSGKAQSDAVAV